MDINQILFYLTPVIVYLVTSFITKIKEKISGSTVVAIIVPILSALLSILNYFLGATENLLLQFALGFLSISIYEIIKQLSEKK